MAQFLARMEERAMRDTITRNCLGVHVSTNLGTDARVLRELKSEYSKYNLAVYLQD